MIQESPKRLSAKELNDWFNKEGPNPVLVDVREDYELAKAAFPSPVVHLPLSKPSIWSEKLVEFLPLNQPVVVICHAGVRSWNFGLWLIEQNFGYEVWNLEGGIDSWSVNIDPSVPRY